MDPKQIENLQAGFKNVSEKLGELCEKESSFSAGMRLLASHSDELIVQMAQLKQLLQDIKLDAVLQSPLSSSVRPAQQPEILSRNIEAFEEKLSVPENTIASPEIPQKAAFGEPPTPAHEPRLEPNPESQTEATNPISRTMDSYERERLGEIKLPLQNEEGNFEFQLGIKWLSRIGIVALLIGLAMALSYSFPNFTKEMKILTGFVLAGGMYGIGHWLFRQAPVLGRILQGGGISIGYLSLFSVFFIPEVQLVTAPQVGLVLLLAYVAGILALAHKLNSQTVALLSLAFGYYTAGYSESYLIAFWSAAILSLGTIGVARLHQNWNIIAKANLVGAFWIYLAWNHRVPMGDISGKLYLAYTFVLFHAVSLLRARQGDVALNLLNISGFFLLFRLTQPDPQPAGSLEYILAGIQFGSFMILNTLYPERKQDSLPYGLLITALVFSVLGIMRFFDTQSMSAVLTAVALCLGLLSIKGTYQKVLVVSTYLLLFFSMFQILIAWPNLSDQVQVVTVAWFGMSTLILESTAFKAHNLALRLIIMIVSMLLFWATILDAVPSEWRTVSFISTGFSLLTLGFILPRKFYRWSGLTWIFVIGGFSLLADLVSLSTGYKIILFILLGAGLLAGSYGYALLEKRLKK